jgi:hypothetical protein
LLAILLISFVFWGVYDSIYTWQHIPKPTLPGILGRC